jgi:transcriptional regulator with XRE-family HTH domain
MGMTPTQAKQLGAVVARARTKKGWSIRELAKQLGVHASWVGFLEQGRYVDPAPDRLARIAELLDIEPGRMPCPRGCPSWAPTSEPSTTSRRSRSSRSSATCADFGGNHDTPAEWRH